MVFPLARPWNSGTREVTEEGEKNGVWDLSLFKVDITLRELHRFPFNRYILMCFFGYIHIIYTVYIVKVDIFIVIICDYVSFINTSLLASPKGHFGPLVGGHTCAKKGHFWISK